MSAYDMGVIQLRTVHLSYLLLSFLIWRALGFEIQDDTSQQSQSYFSYFQIDQPLSYKDPVHHPIVTTSAQAQAIFDQGLAFVYAFNFEEAIRAFEDASKLDPRAAMPYWGIALANNANYNSGIYNSSTREKAAYEAIQRAKELAA